MQGKRNLVRKWKPGNHKNNMDSSVQVCTLQSPKQNKIKTKKNIKPGSVIGRKSSEPYDKNGNINVTK